MSNDVSEPLKTEEVRLDLENADGQRYVGRFEGTALTTVGEITIFRTSDQRILIYAADKLMYWECDDVAELAGILSEHEYVAAANALGETAVIDI